MHRLTSTHWGMYEIQGEGQACALAAFVGDPDPSPIGLSMLEAARGPLRVRRPVVRESCLRHGMGAAPERRGLEKFVEVDWDSALDLAAGALRDTIAHDGNRAIFGGSYGWASAGRFHHAQSQIHRFLNCLGGYVRHADSYSLGAARVLMPHVVASMDELIAQHTSWNVMTAHTQLFVTFGGVPRKNAQVNPGGAGEHLVRDGLRALARAGARFVNISPVAGDLDLGEDQPGRPEWIPIRPNSDTALMLALAHVLVTEDLHDKEFLARYCVGFERFLPYLMGQQDGQPKNPAWAQALTGVTAARIEALAREMAGKRTMLNIAWALQRSQHGEQPFWMLVTLAAMLGQIGLPGGGFGVGYGACNNLGNANPRFSGPTLPQGRNQVEDFIPVARLTDMLEQPGGSFQYNGKTRTYPKISLIYWAGGNPFHHHQDLNRLLAAWRRVPVVIVNEPFWTPTARLADIVFPATTTLERDDIGYATRERYMVAMRRAIAPVGQARDDYAIFSALAERLGRAADFTQGRDVQAWLRAIYDDCVPRAQKAGVALPSFDEFWDPQCGLLDLGRAEQSVVMLEQFRRDPAAHPLATPSGRIEIFSERIAGFGYANCGGHPQWLAPAEWLGSPLAATYPLHLISDQPWNKLHSQLDHSALSRGNKIGGREPVMMHPGDAAARGIAHGDLVCLRNGRGKCLAVAVVSDRIAQGVLKLSTGAWFDPACWDGNALEKHGNPNALTLDIGASDLSQGCSAQSCLVQVQRYDEDPPPVTAFDPPALQSSMA